MSKKRGIRKSYRKTPARSPDSVLVRARWAIAKLEEMMKREKRKPIVYDGERYLTFEDWQFIGEVFGCSVKTQTLGPIVMTTAGQTGPIHNGAGASATLYNKKGVVVGGADACCMREEPEHANRPWFQISSMAQTRAGAKAFRNKFAWVARMGGFKPAVAEEVVKDLGERIRQRKAPNWVGKTGK